MKYSANLFFSVLLASCVVLVGCTKEEPPEESVRLIRVAKVADPNDFQTRWFSGKAKATQEVNLSFRVSGPLVELPVNVGDRVVAGDVLAKIDPRDFEVALRNDQGRLSRAQSGVNRAVKDYNRAINIQKEDAGAISQSMIDRSLEDVQTSKAEVRSLKAAVDAAQDRLGYTALMAPFDGIVTEKYVDNFEDVQAKQPVLRIVDYSMIEMVIDIPEAYISYADEVKAQGKVLKAVFEAFPGVEIPAAISEIGEEASKTTRTYPITLVMDQPEGVQILPGMAGKATNTVRVARNGENQGIIVPDTAVFSAADSKTYVWILDMGSMQVKRSEVTTGSLQDNGIAVLTGLQAGDVIATAGVHYLKDDQVVRISKQAAEEVK